MGKLIITIGISSSGKSTWALNYCAKHTNYVRVNRDDLRSALFPWGPQEYYTKKGLVKREVTVTAATKVLTDEMFANNYNVIQDNTNLKWLYIKEIVNTYGVKNIKIKLMPLDLKTSKLRNDTRVDFVSDEVLDRQSKQYKSLMSNPEFQELYKKCKLEG